MPLSFVTGILGMNIAGMPGTDRSLAFAIVAVGLATLGVLEMWLFRRLGRLREFAGRHRRETSPEHAGFVPGIGPNFTC